MQQVDADTRSAVAANADSDPFAEVVQYIDSNPDADRSELVGRWAGSPLAEEIGRLAQQPHTLPEEAVARELEEGLKSYVAGKEKQIRQALLARIKEDPSPENLKALRSLQAAGANRASRSGT